MISDDNPVDDASVPTTPDSAIRAPNFRSAGQEIGDGLADSNAFKGSISLLLGGVEGAAATVLKFLVKYAAKVLAYFLRIMIQGTEGADDDIASLASLMMSHLLGQNVGESDLHFRRDKSGRPESIHTLGANVMGKFLNAFQPSGDLQPGDDAAKQFVNEAIGMAVDGWILDSVIDWLPEELGKLDQLASLDAKLRQSMGLGRMTHSILSPAIKIIANTPMQWKLEKQYRSKLLSEGTAVEMFLRKNLSREQLNEELARQGYADSRIDALVNERARFISEADALRNWIDGAWTDTDAYAYFQRRGYDDDVTLGLYNAEKERRIVTQRVKAMEAAERAYVTRFIDLTEFTKYVTAAVKDADIQHEIIAQASAVRELNRSRVSEGKAEEAVLLGFWGIQDYTDHLQKLGYNDDDIITMQLLTQDRIAQQSDKLQARKDAAAARAATKAAALLKAQQRQAQLDQSRTHRALSLAQVHRGYVQGRLTLPQLQAFLVEEKQDPADIQTLLDLAQAERADYQLAQTKKARANEKLAVTTLSTAQLEHLVKNEQISMLDYQTILEKEGVPEDDVALLIKAAAVDLQAAQEAKAHRVAVAAKTAEKGLSLAQMEAAVRQGLRSMTDFTKWLTDNHYGPPDIASLTGLLQDRIAADKLAEQKKEATATKLAHRPISLAAMELAVRKGLRPIADYQQELIDEGVNVHDVATLTGLLQAKIADDAAAAKRKAAAAVRAATKGITLADIERAARLGIVAEAYYRQALIKAGMPPEDQDVMIGLLHDDQAKVQLARVKQAEAEAKLKNKPATLANLKHGVMFGIRTIADYRAALQEAGFDADAVDLMAELAQDEIAQAKVSVDRKAALAAQHPTREISRADFEKAVVDGFKTLDDYKAFLVELKYDEEDQGILYDLLAKKMGL